MILGSWEIFIISTVTTVLLAILVGLLIWQLFKTLQTRAATKTEIAHDEAYKTLAEQAAAAQRKTADDLSALAVGVAELRTRVAAIEKLLREVE